jgi:ubiquinone/menaquinone biosynthesis C-methylase UbiE
MFGGEGMKNIDDGTVKGFGDEWARFDHVTADETEIRRLWGEYFEIFPRETLSMASSGADFGCGSGRWARHIAGKVSQLYCVDASNDALAVAKVNLREFENVEYLNESLSEMSIGLGSLDFGYSLGVLHHVPDTEDALKKCVETLKPGAPFLVYLYYAFDNRPAWYWFAWKTSDFFRNIISKMPFRLRYWGSQIIAIAIYWPVARCSRVLESMGVDVANIPLSYYRDKSFYVLRTDSLDRFGTRLEKRFSREDMVRMMNSAGLENVRFSEGPPYWVAIGIRRSPKN